MKKQIWLSIVVADRAVSERQVQHACAFRLDERELPEEAIRSLLGSQAAAIAKILAERKS